MIFSENVLAFYDKTFGASIRRLYHKFFSSSVKNIYRPLRKELLGFYEKTILLSAGYLIFIGGKT